jgi:putative DNA primase/helicase
VTGDGHKNSETRRALQPLVDFASEAGVAVLGVTHYSKGTSGRDPSERVTGSLAFVAVSRLVMATAKSKEPAQPWRLVRAKSNIGPDGGGFEYALRQIPVDQNKAVSGQCIVWGEKLEGDAKTLLAEIETPNEPGNPSTLDAAKAWLPEMLGTGIVAVTYVRDVARTKGHAWGTVQRAKTALGVVSLKTGTDGGWAWQMPKVITDAEGAQH